jgi:hypothetical protein
MNELAVVAILTVLGIASATGGLLVSQLRVPLILAALVGFLAASAQIYVLVRGSVMLVDPTGRVVTAELVNGGHARAMHRAPFGLFYGEPRGDAHVRLTCAGGRTAEFGYATPGMPIYKRLYARDVC